MSDSSKVMGMMLVIGIIAASISLLLTIIFGIMIAATKKDNPKLGTYKTLTGVFAAITVAIVLAPFAGIFMRP